MKKILCVTFIALCVCVGLTNLRAQTYHATPVAHITMSNGQPIDTLIAAGNSFAGQAPLQVNYRADLSISTGRLHFDWEFADNAAFQNADHSREQEFSRRLERRGGYYVRLTITDLDTDSSTLYDVIQISLSESRLAVPNTFTPNGDGVHDVLKVSYESLVKFQAVVFNRWGQRLYSWTNPDEGWDGDDQPVGVYYIVVEAEGGDGLKYSFRQAVNLLR